MNKPVFNIGPMVPLKPGTTEFSQASLDAEVAATPGGMSVSRVGNIGDAIVKFLNNALEKYGESSVVYISFGTFFWWVLLITIFLCRTYCHRPTNGDHLVMLLETFEKRGIPFVSTN
jgi:hypothetical protein